MPLYRPRPALPVLRPGHPLAAGLVWGAAPGGGHLRDTFGVVGTVIGSANYRAATAFGPAVESTSTSNQGYRWPMPPGFASNVGLDHTIALVADIDSVDAGGGSVFSIPYDTAASWTSPFNAMRLVCSGGGTTCQYRMGTAASVFNGGDSASGFFDVGTGVPRLYVVTRSSASLIFYKDGLRHSTASCGNPTDPPSFANSADLHVLNRKHNQTGEGVDGRLNLAAVWGRALSPSEVARIAADPFGFLRPPSSARIFPFGGSAAVNATASPSVVTSTGTIATATATGAANVAASVVASTATLPTATATGTGAGTGSPAVVTATGVAPDAVATGDANVTASVVTSTATLPAVTASSGEGTNGTASPSVVTALFVLPAVVAGPGTGPIFLVFDVTPSTGDGDPGIDDFLVEYR